MTGLAQATPVLWIVGVQAAGDEFAPAQRPVVGHDGSRLTAQRADGMLGQYAWTETGLVLATVATLGGATALPVGLGAAASAAPLLCEFRA